MADTQETIADVVRKIRNEIAELRKVSPNVPSIAADWWEARADEIEAAHKRECGDFAKLREALESVAKQLTDATEDENFGEDVMYLVGCMRTMSQKCRVTLSTTSNQNT